MFWRKFFSLTFRFSFADFQDLYLSKGLNQIPHCCFINVNPSVKKCTYSRLSKRKNLVSFCAAGSLPAHDPRFLVRSAPAGRVVDSRCCCAITVRAGINARHRHGRRSGTQRRPIQRSTPVVRCGASGDRPPGNNASSSRPLPKGRHRTEGSALILADWTTISADLHRT